MTNSAKEYKDVRDMFSKQQRAVLESKWSKYTDSVKKADPTLSTEKALRIQAVLENVDREIAKYMRKNEGTQVADVGAFRMHVFPLITAMYATSIADQLVNVTPVTQRTAQIFFLNYLYDSNKGPVKDGDPMLSAWTGASDYDHSKNYASEVVEGEYIAAAGTTNVEANLAYVPVRRGMLSVDLGGDTAIDNGKGGIVLQSDPATSIGSIDYNSGAIDIDLSGVATTEDIYANYVYDLDYAPTKSGRVRVKMDEAIVTCRPHPLSSQYAFGAGYDMEMAYGINIDDALLEAATSELRHERDGSVISKLFLQAGATSTWNATIPTALTQKEHYESFIHELFRGSTRIMQSTKRAAGNWAVCGKNGIDTLNAVGAPRFVGTGEFAPAGPHLAGILDNRMRVYYDPFLAEDDYLVGFRGEQFFDSGFVLADYLPIFATSMMMLDDFVGRRGYVSIYGEKMVNRNMYVKGQITHI